MADLDTQFQILSSAWESGGPVPVDLAGQVTGDDVYRLQLRTLDRVLAKGARQAGWKVGQTNRALREERGESMPAPGFLLETDRHASGVQLELGDGDPWFLEPEMAVLLASDLAGPGVTQEQARSAVQAVAPAYELVRPPRAWPDRDLVRAVNGATHGFVLGDARPVSLDAAQLDDMRVSLALDGVPFGEVRGGDVIDNPLDTLAWLANYLGSLGSGLLAGHVLLTGTYMGLVPMEAGQRWSASVGDFGTVELLTR